jgi:5-methyltetrahydrofolate--homocysteine methyltransferase
MIMDFSFPFPFLFACPANGRLPDSFSGFSQLTADFVKAGTDAVCAPTLTANRAWLAASAPGNDPETLNAKLMGAVRKAAGNCPAGGLLGPTGMFVPPFGEDDFDAIYSVYREQVLALKKAGADFLLLDRQNSLADMRAALLAARNTGLPVLICLSVDGSGHTLTGGDFLPALITLQAMGASAIGLSGDPENGILLENIRAASAHASAPLVFLADTDSQKTSGQFAEAAKPLIQAGVRLFGAGRNTDPEDIRALKNILKKNGPPKIRKEPDCYAAAIEREAFFLGSDLVFSQPIECTSALEDDLIDLDDEQVNTALVKISSIDDAVLLAESSSMTKLPVAVCAENPSVLEAALRYFQGRLIVDSRSAIEPEVLEPLTAKYGAILY